MSDLITVTGDAILLDPEPGLIIPSLFTPDGTFTFSFMLDGSLPVSNPRDYNLTVPVQNFILTVGGHTYTAATANFWSVPVPFCDTCTQVDSGMNISAPGVAFTWVYGSMNPSGSTLAQVLSTQDLSSDGAAINQHYASFDLNATIGFDDPPPGASDNVPVSAPTDFMAVTLWFLVFTVAMALRGTHPWLKEHL